MAFNFIKRIAPAMVFAGQPESFALGLCDDRCAAMRANVIKGFHLSLFSVDQHDGLASLLPLDIAARLWDFVEVCRKQPGFFEDLTLF